VLSVGGAAGGRVRPVQTFWCDITTTFQPPSHKSIQQHWNNSTGPLGLVVKRITSMTSESANDKIARSIRAEGILFAGHLFALA
jgi:hypothetical protein